jgi:hypothetical protein
MHVTQLTPPGSGCSIVFGDLPPHKEMEPGFGFHDPDGNSWAVQEIKARERTPLIPRDHTGLRAWAGR